MITDQLIARIGTELPALVEVGGALDLDRLLSAGAAKVRAPAAYVLPLGERVLQRETMVGATAQALRERYGVVQVLTLKNRARGEAAERALNEARQALRAAVLGWQADAGRTPFLFAAGRLIDTRAARVFWQDEFECDVWIRA